jgi:hypothetical protein
MYTVSNQAHDRGYGPPDEIVRIAERSRLPGQAYLRYLLDR